MREERDLFSCRKLLVRSGANKIQVRVLCLPTMPDRNNGSLIRSGKNERIPPENRVCEVGTTARSHV